MGKMEEEHTFLVGNVHVARWPCLSLFGRAQDNRVVGMGLDMLLEILRAFESLAAKLAFVWFQWYMNSDVRGDVVTFDSCGTTTAPLAGQVQVIGAFSTDMPFADMFL